MIPLHFQTETLETTLWNILRPVKLIDWRTVIIMHEEPIHHLYTNKKLKLWVNTSNGLRFVCSPTYDSCVRSLQQLILQKYNEFIADPTHRYYEAGPKARGVYNIRVKSYYLSPSDYVIDVLNDFDEIECDINEIYVGLQNEKLKKRDMKKLKAMQHEIPEEEESIVSSSNTNNALGQSRRRKRRKQNADGAQSVISKDAGVSNSFIESPRHFPASTNLPNLSDSKGKVEVDSQSKKQLTDNKADKRLHKSSDGIVEQSRPQNSRISVNEVPEFELHPTEPIKVQQSKQSEQKSERSLNSPHVRPAPKPMQTNSHISREDSSLRLESDRSHDEGTFKMPKPKPSSLIKTPEIEPVKSPYIKPMPSLTRQPQPEEKSKPNENKMQQSITSIASQPNKKNQDTCIVIAESEVEEQPTQSKAQAQKPQQSQVSQKSPPKQVSKPQQIQKSQPSRPPAKDPKLDKYLTKEFVDIAESVSSSDED